MAFIPDRHGWAMRPSPGSRAAYSFYPRVLPEVKVRASTGTRIPEFSSGLQIITIFHHLIPPRSSILAPSSPGGQGRMDEASFSNFPMIFLVCYPYQL